MIRDYDGVEEAVPSKKTLIDVELCEAVQASEVWNYYILVTFDEQCATFG